MSLLQSQSQLRCTVSNWSGVPEFEQGVIGERVPKCGAGLEQVEKMSNVNITIGRKRLRNYTLAL